MVFQRLKRKSVFKRMMITLFSEFVKKPDLSLHTTKKLTTLNKINFLSSARLQRAFDSAFQTHGDAMDAKKESIKT